MNRTGRAGEQGLALTIVEGEHHRELKAYDDGLAEAPRRVAAEFLEPGPPRPAKLQIGWYGLSMMLDEEYASDLLSTRPRSARRSR